MKLFLLKFGLSFFLALFGLSKIYGSITNNLNVLPWAPEVSPKQQITGTQDAGSRDLRFPSGIDKLENLLKPCSESHAA
jgi:hypothetical protein